MFLLIQFSAFDFRYFQAPELLVPPLRVWPLTRPNKDFVNHFGKIKESYGSVLAPHLLPEDNVYVEADNALKFQDLTATDLPFSIEVKMRRLCPDSRGGLKFFIGLSFNFQEEIPFATLAESLDYFCALPVEILLPGEGKKEMDLFHAGPSLKSLYVHASTLSSIEDPRTYFVQNTRSSIMLDLSGREYEHFSDLSSYNSYAFPDDLKIYHHKAELKGSLTDVFLTQNLDTNKLNRLAKYRISRFLAHLDNAASLLHYKRMGNSLSEKAIEELQLISAFLEDKIQPQDWKTIVDLGQSLFRTDILKIKQELKLFLPQIGSSKIAELRREGEEALKEGDWDRLFGLIQEHKSLLEDEEWDTAIQLQFQYNSLQRDFGKNLLALEEKMRAESRISSAFLNLFRTMGVH